MHSQCLLQVRQLFTDAPDEAQLMLDRKKAAKFQGVVAKFQQQVPDECS